MPKFDVEMNFCRRCGGRLEHQEGSAYICEKGHPIYANASPSVGLVIFNDQNEVLILERAIDPGKGGLNVPGGYCDGPERLEDAVAREVKEEVGLEPSDYTEPEFVISDLDPYDYHGEVLPAVGSIFKARLITGKEPVAGDDAASVKWVPASEIDLEKIYFPAVRAGLRKAIEEL